MNSIYTPLDEIRPVLAARRNDRNLVSAVLGYLGDDQPQFVEALRDPFTHPSAILCRPLATPNVEMTLFTATARRLGFAAQVLEYPDRFVTANAEKRALWRISFDARPNERGLRDVTLFDPTEHQGKHLASIRTRTGLSLRAFHNGLVSAMGGAGVGSHDMSSWFSDLKERHADHYERFMSVFMFGAVWFEDFLFDDKRESAYLNGVVLPAAEALQRRFGLKPMVCNFVPQELSQSPKLLKYDSVHAGLINKLAGTSPVHARAVA
jgi:hypothetical protein